MLGSELKIIYAHILSGRGKFKPRPATVLYRFLRWLRNDKSIVYVVENSYYFNGYYYTRPMYVIIILAATYQPHIVCSWVPLW